MAKWAGLIFLVLACGISSGAFYADKQMQQSAPGVDAFPSLEELPVTGETRPRPPYLINIFASWCVPCLAELPYLREWQNQTGLPLIGVAWRDKPSAVADWLEKHEAPFDTVYEDTDGNALSALSLEGLPMSYLIDAEGEIVFTHRGVLTEENLPELLKESKTLVESNEASEQ
tara:strand:+ start:3076 stop:3594 length:519 start_codon:yes stop_codon:yes gene_type:complete